MRSAFTILLSILLISSALAQDNPTRLALDEQSAEQVQTFYEKPGTMGIHLSNFMFTKDRTAFPPLNFHVSVTAFRNFTVAPMFSYARYKNSLKDRFDRVTYSQSDVHYHLYMVGLKGEYHLMPMLQRLINKPTDKQLVDPYISVWGGYGIVRVSEPDKTDPVFVEKIEKIYGGAAIGMRTMLLPRWALFVEAGYSSYGFGSIGTTILLN